VVVQAVGEGGGGNPGTTAGTYTITVTGASGAITETGTVALTVQQLEWRQRIDIPVILRLPSYSVPATVKVEFRV
jgi:hypothetical protein